MRGLLYRGNGYAEGNEDDTISSTENTMEFIDLCGKARRSYSAVPNGCPRKASRALHG